MNFDDDYTLDDYTEALKRAGVWDRPEIFRRTAGPDEPEMTPEESERCVVECFAYETITRTVQQLLDEVSVKVNQVKELPEEDGLYFLYHWHLTISGRRERLLIYVGSSVNLRVRWQTHNFRCVLGHKDYSLFWKPTCYSKFTNHMIEEAFYVSLFQPELNVIISRVQLRRFPGDEGPLKELIPALCKMYASRRK